MEGPTQLTAWLRWQTHRWCNSFMQNFECSYSNIWIFIWCGLTYSCMPIRIACLVMTVVAGKQCNNIIVSLEVKRPAMQWGELSCDMHSIMCDLHTLSCYVVDTSCIGLSSDHARWCTCIPCLCQVPMQTNQMSCSTSGLELTWCVLFIPCIF